MPSDTTVAEMLRTMAMKLQHFGISGQECLDVAETVGNYEEQIASLRRRVAEESRNGARYIRNSTSDNRVSPHDRVTFGMLVPALISSRSRRSTFRLVLECFAIALAADKEFNADLNITMDGDKMTLDLSTISNDWE